VGGGARWQGKFITGYPITVDSDGATVIHVDRPYYGEPELKVDAWIGYRRKIWKDQIDWRVRLGATNVIGGTGLKNINAEPSGEHAGLRIPPEKRWSLSNTFEFQVWLRMADFEPAVYVDDPAKTAALEPGLTASGVPPLRTGLASLI
jgi:hypothetical protein